MRFQSAIAPESAVSVAVDAAKKFRADKFVNAVLRRFVSDRTPISSAPADILPPAVYKRWKKRYTEDTLKLMAELFTAEPPFSFRMEKGTPNGLVTALYDLSCNIGDPISLVGVGECPIFEKFDDMIPAELLRTAYAEDKLDLPCALRRIGEQYSAIKRAEG